VHTQTKPKKIDSTMAVDLNLPPAVDDGVPGAHQDMLPHAAAGHHMVAKHGAPSLDLNTEPYESGNTTFWSTSIPFLFMGTSHLLELGQGFTSKIDFIHPCS
jgi:hypothetical protein